MVGPWSVFAFANLKISHKTVDRSPSCGARGHHHGQRAPWWRSPWSDIVGNHGPLLRAAEILSPLGTQEEREQPGDPIPSKVTGQPLWSSVLSSLN